jgi:hypothetical protein
VPGADPAGHYDHVRVGQFVEGGIHGQPEEAVLGPDLALAVADEGNRRLGEALQHFVRPDRVECGDSGEQGNGDAHYESPSSSGCFIWRQ